MNQVMSYLAAGRAGTTITLKKFFDYGPLYQSKLHTEFHNTELHTCIFQATHTHFLPQWGRNLYIYYFPSL